MNTMLKLVLALVLGVAFYFFPLHISLMYVFVSYSIMGYLHTIALTDDFCFSELLFAMLSWLVAPFTLIIVTFIMICAKQVKSSEEYTK